MTERLNCRRSETAHRDYFTVPRKIWQKNLGMPDSAIPHKLIIEGRIRTERGFASRSSKLSDVKPGWEPGIITGRYRGQKVAYALCVGGPVASQICHLFCKLGVKKIVLIGTCGGLQKYMELGDLIVSEKVLSLDGSAKLYKQRSKLVNFDKGLVKAAVDLTKIRKLKHHVGKTVSYFDILLEEWKDLLALGRAGYIGVDMEAAAVASVARFFKVPAACVLSVSDNSITGKDIFRPKSDAERELANAANEATFDIALEL